MPYQVTIAQAASRAIRSLDRPLQARVLRAVGDLGNDPRPHGAKMLSGMNLWRVRVGDWRIVYQIEDSRLVVLVVSVAHRSSVYRDL